MSDNAEKFLKTWLHVLDTHHMDSLTPIIAEDIVFYSPAFWTPKEGRDVAIVILKTVDSILENFTYTKHWIDGDEIILEFSAQIGGKNIKGIDRITLNEDGQAKTFEVMVRPLNGLIALAQAMGEKLGLASS